MNDVFSFLGLQYYEISDKSKKNKIDYDAMKIETRTDLIDFFRPYNEKLYSLLGRNFDWEH